MRSSLVLLIGATLLAGCTTDPVPDSGGGVDLGGGERIRPPDLGTMSDSRQGNVGSPCDPESQQGCTGEAACLQISSTQGMCAIPDCTLEDITTSVAEDNCPPLLGSTPRRSVCTPYPVPGADGGTRVVNFCMPECKPAPDKNTCAAVHPGLSCDPITLLLNGHSEVCLVPGCDEKTSCTGSSPAPIASCDLSSGICLHSGVPGVEIGSPCASSSQCGPGQFCLREYTDPKTQKMVLAGGYCTLVGCMHHDPAISDLWKCPAGSECFQIGSSKTLSLCLAVGCDWKLNPDKDGCRDSAPAGQYTCTLQDGFGVCWLDVKGDS